MCVKNIYNIINICYFWNDYDNNFVKLLTLNKQKFNPTNKNYY